MVDDTEKKVIALDGVLLDALEDRKAQSLATSCVNWFNQHPDELGYFMKTLRRQTGVSLRVLDYFITNYSRRHRMTVMYHGLPLDLNNDYKRHLLIHTKRLFDAFARRSRIQLRFDTEQLSTTVGQLNFFRWLLERNVQTVLLGMKEEVENDMKRVGQKEGDGGDERFIAYTGPFVLTF